MALSGLSVLNRNNVHTYCANLDPNLDLSNGFAVLSWSIFITTEGFMLLNRANSLALGGLALGGLALGLLKLIDKSQTRLEGLFNAAELKR